jgi:hypothetical protein
MKPSSRKKPKAKKAHVLWTAKETEKLRELVKDKTAIREIAKTLGKSEKAIRRKCDWLGISSATTYRKPQG